MPLPILKPFQEPLVRQIREALQTHHSVVLAACPGAGKTIMSLDIMLDYLRAGKIVLVLTHGTKVLLEQWTNRVKTFGLAEYLSNGQLILKLPQSKAAIKKLLADKQIALLVVDEAHEFYFAHRLIEGEVKHGTVQQIIKDHKPEKELLLTGTPSKFIYDKQINKSDRPIIICPGTEVFRAGMLQDTYFGMVKSAYNFRMNYEKPHDEDTDENETPDTSDFNDKGDLKQTLYIDPKQTRDSLVNLVAEMIERLSQVALKDNINVANTLTYLPPVVRSWASVFGTLEKTMIAAHSIEQAKALRDVLEEQFKGSDARVVLSVSKGMSDDPDDIDEDGNNIKIFQADPKIKVLIVVRRGILGFDMFDLCNVVDFTCSRNINRIYQLYARVLRAHSGHNKFFFRVASSENPSIDSFFLQAALCLNNRDFISRFNGKNLSVMDVIVPRNRKLSDRKRTGSSDIIIKDKTTPVDALMYWEILNLEFMTEMSINSNSPYWKEFEKVKFGKVMNKLTGKVFGDPEGKKRALLDLGHRVTTKDGLYKNLNSYLTPSSSSYDPDFATEYERRYPREESSTTRKKEELLGLGRRATPKDGLYKNLNSYLTPSSSSYDPDFATEYERRYPESSTTRKKEEILGLGRRVTTKDGLYNNLRSYLTPSSSSYDPDFATEYERRYPESSTTRKKEELLGLGRRATPKDGLYKNLKSYWTPSSSSYDPDFATEYERRYPKEESPATQKKEELLTFGRRVNTKDGLYNNLSSYLTPSSNCYDPNFATEYERRYPGPATQKKEELLTFGRRVNKKDKLYGSWCSYYYSSGSCYDPDFATEYERRYPSKRKKKSAISRII